MQRESLLLHADNMCLESGWYLEAGKTYCFNAVEKEPLYDKSICSPSLEGFDSSYPNGRITQFIMRLFERCRRRPHDNWFALVGGIKVKGELVKQMDVNSDHFFLMGSKTKIVAEVSGEFVCFVNDVAWMYKNNRGTISIKIQKV